MPTQLFLIRHGQPETTSSVPYLVPPGPDLSERGRLEAHQAAAFLARLQIGHCVASPFARTTQTAEIVSRHLATGLQFSDDIAEHGPHEGFETVRTRVRTLLAQLRDHHAERIALVSHGSPIRALLLECSAGRIDLSGHVYQGGNPAPTCGIWQIDLTHEAAQRCQLVFRPQAG